MDLSHFNMDGSAFENTPNPDCFVTLAAHREALDTLQGAIDDRRGLSVLDGLPGTGKTLITRLLKQRLGYEAAVGIITRPCADIQEFEDAILDAFRLNRRSTAGSLGSTLERYLDDLYQQDIAAVLIIENVHELPADCLDLLQRLTRFEADDMPLLQILLVGWPDFMAGLDGLADAAIRQRVYRHIRLQPLSENDTAAYIRGRIRIANGPEEALFSDDAIELITKRTGGIPRLINALCDRLLVDAARDQVHMINGERVRTMAFEQEFDPARYAPSPAQAPAVPAADLAERSLVDALTTRIEALEAALQRQHAETEEFRAEQPRMQQQLRRHDRVLTRMVPMFRALRQHHDEAKGVLHECRKAREQYDAMLTEPESILRTVTDMGSQIRALCDDAQACVATMQKVDQELRQSIAEAEQSRTALSAQCGETAPQIEQARRMTAMLRRMHDMATGQCTTLGAITERATALCESLPAYLARTEEVMATPQNTLKRLQAADNTLRQRIEAGENQCQHVEKALQRAVQTVCELRQQVEKVRRGDTAPARPAAPARLATPMPAKRLVQGDPASLARRVRDLRSQIESLRQVMPARIPVPTE
ncbi:MAG: AAA family ATPase [Phycisphaerae bacterium]|nr:AAA family ATPase [Phycisphaerae bacterium]